MVEVSRIKDELRNLGTLLPTIIDKYVSEDSQVFVPQLQEAIVDERLSGPKVSVIPDDEYDIDVIPLRSLNTQPFTSVASIDSSSRLVRSSMTNLVISSGSAYSTLRGRLNYPFDVTGQFCAVAGSLKSLRDLESVSKSKGLQLSLVKLRNVAGYEYALDRVEVENARTNRVEIDSLYDINDVSDELRLEAENALIETMNKEDLLILDGPVIPTVVEILEGHEYLYKRPARLKELNHWGKMTHIWSMAEIVKKRKELLKRRKAVGVVKRLDLSFKLSKVDELAKALGISLDVFRQLRDVEILELVSRKFCDRPHSICTIGPLKIEHQSRVKRDDTGQEILNDTFTKYAYYAILNVPGVRSFFRIETTDRSLLDPAFETVFSRISDNGLPTYIDVVDRLAKRTASAAFVLTYDILKEYVTMAHDTKLEYFSTLSTINQTG